MTPGTVGWTFVRPDRRRHGHLDTESEEEGLATRPRFDVLADGGHYFEGPRWHDGRWWASDVYAGEVRSWSERGDAAVEATLDDMPSGLGWLPDGALLVVSMRRQKVLRRGAGGLTVHADLSGSIVAEANDMLVDAAGRAWVGAVGFDMAAGQAPTTSVVVRVDPDGRIVGGADGLLFPNGMVMADGGRTLVVAETFAARLTAFTVSAGGELVDRRVWANLEESFAPDGCAIDAEGAVWAADARARRVVRIGEGGRVLDEVVPPDDLACFAVGLGGTDGRTLCLCVAPSFDPAARLAGTDALLVTTQVQVPAPAF